MVFGGLFGKLFQIRGPAAEKLRSPKRVRVLGTMPVLPYVTLRDAFYRVGF